MPQTKEGKKTDGLKKLLIIISRYYSKENNDGQNAEDLLDLSKVSKDLEEGEISKIVG